MDQFKSEEFLTSVIEELQRIKSYWSERLKIATANSIDEKKSKKAIILCGDAVNTFNNLIEYIQNHSELEIIDQCTKLKDYWDQQQTNFGYKQLQIDAQVSTLVSIYELIINSIENIEIITIE
ncbi:hypothetical protein [Enterococcus sp. AZ126]|uniref:hypothetical protein n=1 Tax=Enterococcus sp. AZ126 TaxID=2774635 RepID=UPI003F2840E3